MSAAVPRTRATVFPTDFDALIALAPAVGIAIIAAFAGAYLWDNEVAAITAIVAFVLGLPLTMYASKRSGFWSRAFLLGTTFFAVLTISLWALRAGVLTTRPSILSRTQ